MLASCLQEYPFGDNHEAPAEPNRSAWQPVWEGCPCCPAKTLDRLFKDSRNNLFQAARGTASQEPKRVSGTDFHGFVLDLIGKEGKFPAATSSAGV